MKKIIIQIFFLQICIQIIAIINGVLNIDGNFLLIIFSNVVFSYGFLLWFFLSGLGWLWIIVMLYLNFLYIKKGDIKFIVIQVIFSVIMALIFKLMIIEHFLRIY